MRGKAYKMGMIFDLHNDYLTHPQFLTLKARTWDKTVLNSADNAENNAAFNSEGKAGTAKFSDSVIYAVWTTRLSNPVRFLKEVSRLGLKRTAIEDLHFMTSQDYSLLHSLKPAYASLTWNGENRLGGGADTDLGLTAEGREVIKILFSEGITLDTAHLSRRAFEDAAELITELTAKITSNTTPTVADKTTTAEATPKETTKVAAETTVETTPQKAAKMAEKATANVAGIGAQVKKSPIICSHTCFDGVFNHRRNLTDRQISTIISSGGIVGLCLVPKFMGVKEAGIEDVVKQIDYFCTRFTHKSLSIGTDFFGTDYPALKAYGDFDILRLRLSKLGYKEHEINAIFYQNAIEFFGK